MRKLIVFVAAGALAVTGLVAPALATFKGSNGRLLYQGIVGEHEQLFTVKPDGSDVRQLTDFPDSDATDASWSPDSTKIAFVRRWGPNKGRIYTMKADGSAQRELDRLLQGTPAWFPDGKHLLVLRKLRWTIVTPSRRRAPLRRHARLGGQPLACSRTESMSRFRRGSAAPTARRRSSSPRLVADR